MLHIHYLEYSPRILLVPDMQDRLHYEIAPPSVIAPRACPVIAVVLDIEPVFPEHVLDFLILDQPSLLGVLRLVILSSPYLAVPVLLDERIQVHVRRVLVSAQGKQP